MMGDLPRWKNSLEGLNGDGWPTQVSGVSIVTDDLPGSDYDGWPARVSGVSIVTDDLPGSDYDGWPTRMEEEGLLYWVTYPDEIDGVGLIITGDLPGWNWWCRWGCNAWWCMHTYLRNIGPLFLMLHCCRMPLHSLQSFVVIHSTKLKHIAYSGLSAMISAFRAYQV